METSLSRIMGCTSIDALAPILPELAERFGFAASTYADISQRPQPDGTAPFFTTSLGDPFLAAYHGDDFTWHDPIVHQALASNAPFRWLECPEYAAAVTPRPGAKSKVRRLFELASDFDYHDGYVIPCHARDPQGQPRSGIVSLFWGGLGLREPLPTWFRLAALVYHERAIHLLNTAQGMPVVASYLTDREREVLLWAARGKTAGETADILRIGERTVEFHIRNAMRKLGVYNKVHCVAVAVQQGLIAP